MGTYDKDEFLNPDFTDICRYCGEIGLQWVKYRNKWWLINKNLNKHICGQYEKTKNKSNKIT